MGYEKLVSRVIAGNGVGAIIHLAGSIVVPDWSRPTRLLFQQYLQSNACLCCHGD